MEQIDFIRIYGAEAISIKKAKVPENLNELILLGVGNTTKDRLLDCHGLIELLQELTEDHLITAYFLSMVEDKSDLLLPKTSTYSKV